MSNVDSGNAPIGRLLGIEEIKESLYSVISALRKADLHEEVRLICERIVVPAFNNACKIFEWEQVSANTVRCRYKPMVELALLEIKEAAVTPGWTDSMRKKRILEILEMSGF